MTRAAEVIGQEAPLALLRRMIAHDRVPHALLFHGPEGVGTSDAARLTAAALLCEGPREARPCRGCAQCRLVEHGAHLDLTLVERPPKKSGEGLSAQIHVDQIRDVVKLAGFAPRQAARRVFIIDPADRMNPNAQNALLKTLEEPPGNAVLILVAARPHLLEPTVRSRSFAVGFAPLRTVELARHLEARGLPAAEAAARAALAAGRPRRAVELDFDGERARRDELLRMLERMSEPRRELGRIPALGAALAGKTEDDMVADLELLAGLLRDVSLCAAGEPAARLLHADLAARLAAVGARLGPVRAARLVEGTERLRAELRVNANRRYMAETLLAAVAGGPLP